MVQVTKYFYIDSDEKSYVVVERKQVKEGKCKGEIREENCGYYTTFKGAIQGIYKILTRRMVHKYDITLEEAINKLDEMYGRYLNSLKEVSGGN